MTCTSHLISNLIFQNKFKYSYPTIDKKYINTLTKGDLMVNASNFFRSQKWKLQIWNNGDRFIILKVFYYWLLWWSDYSMNVTQINGSAVLERSIYNILVCLYRWNIWFITAEVHNWFSAMWNFIFLTIINYSILVLTFI